MRFLRRYLSVCTMLLLAAIPVRAQAPADRAFFDSLLNKLATASAATALPSESLCSNRGADLARLCQGLIVQRRG